MREDELLAAKQRVAQALLAIREVAGAGVGAGRLNVYLALDTPAVRESIRKIMDSAAPGVPYECVVSGEFTAQ